MKQSHAGVELSAEHCRRIAEALSGKKKSPEHCKKIGDIHRGRKRSAESRRRMSLAFTGRVITKEQRTKIGDALRGRKLSPEHVKKIADMSRKRLEDPAERENLSRAIKRSYEHPSDAVLRRFKDPSIRRKMSESQTRHLLHSWVQGVGGVGFGGSASAPVVAGGCRRDVKGASAMMEAILAFAEARGAKNLRSLPGCWVERVDEHWTIAANGHKEPRECWPIFDCMRVVIPPFHFAVWFNGWLAGVLDPATGGVFAAGSAANEEEFKAALKAATAKEGKEET